MYMGTNHTADSGNVRLTLDQALQLLSNGRRRAVMDRLSTEGATTRSALADHLEATMDGGRKSHYVSLYQCHLPKMADHGVIVYDQRAGDVEPGPAFADTYSVMVRAREGRSLTSVVGNVMRSLTNGSA